MQDAVDNIELRRRLKWSLGSTSGQIDENGGLKEWFVRKLEGSGGWALMDKGRLSQRALEATRRHYIDGWPVETIASRLFVSEKTIIRDWGIVIDALIDAMTPAMKAHLLKKPDWPRWQLKGCPRCGGDLYLEEEDREYICLQCGNRRTD